MNLFKKLLFRIDSICMGAAKGMIINGKYDSAWETSFFLAERSYRNPNVMNFEIALQLCIEILELDYSRKRLVNIVGLFTSSTAPHKLQKEGGKLVHLLKTDGLDDLVIEVQAALNP